MEKILVGDVVSLEDNSHNMLRDYPKGELFHVVGVINGIFLRVRSTKQSRVVQTDFHISRFTPILRRK